MQDCINKVHNKFNKTAFILILSVILSRYNITIGFALKPHMILVCLVFIVNMKNFYFHKLYIHELFLLIFYFYFSFTGIYARFPLASLRMSFGIIIMIATYFIMKYILSRITIFTLEKNIANVGILFNLVSLALYFIGLYTINFNFRNARQVIYGLMLERNTPRLIGLLTGIPN